MEDDLAAHLTGGPQVSHLPGDDQSQLKSYVIEAHHAGSAHEATEILEAAAIGAGGSVEQTGDKTLHALSLPIEQDGRPAKAGFWVDAANPRFWLLHSKMNVGPSQAALRALLGTSALDRAWMPRNKLRQIQREFTPSGFRLRFDERPFYNRSQDLVELEDPTHKLSVEHAGVGAEGMYQLLAESPVTRRALALSEVAFWESSSNGLQMMRLRRDGRLRSTGGSVGLHLQASRELIRNYETFVLAIEQEFSLRAIEDPDRGIQIEGRPIGIRASKPAGLDFQKMVSRLISGVEPFRLLGTVEWADEDLAHVDAVDLHSAAPIRVDLTPDWIRLYLPSGSCGNTVARFVTNLQGGYSADLGYYDAAAEQLLAA